MIVATLEGTNLIEVTISSSPVPLDLEDRRRVMCAVRELQTLGFVQSISTDFGDIHGSANDRVGATLRA